MSKNWKIEVFFYVSVKNKRILKAFSTKPEERENYEIKSIIFEMKPFTWAFHSYLTKECCVNGNLNDVDYMLMKEKKIIDGIVDWDIVDSENKKIPVTKEKIFSLPPTVVETLVAEYDDRSYVNPKERKRLLLDTNKYYMSQNSGGGRVQAPLEVVELSLMEKFSWTPQEIDEIPYKKIQEMFLILNQRDSTEKQTHRGG